MKITFSSITSGLVGGLVLSYVLFMGYVLTMAQQSHSPPARIATIGCFSFGHCPVAFLRKISPSSQTGRRKQPIF